MRRHIADHRGACALLLAAALLLRLLIPAGFMPELSDGGIRLVACSGMMPMATAQAHHGGHHQPSDDGKSGASEMPCTYAGMGLAMLGAVPPALLAAAILFAFVHALRPSAPRPRPDRRRLRPPLRAPPLPA